MQKDEGAMQKWEYKIERINFGRTLSNVWIDDPFRELNASGYDGWELCSAVELNRHLPENEASDWRLCIFKRPFEEYNGPTDTAIGQLIANTR